MDVITISLTFLIAALLLAVIIMSLRKRELSGAEQALLLQQLEAVSAAREARMGPAPSLRVVTGDPDKLCATCVHFDLEDGQAMAAAHAPFAIAATHVPPTEMGAIATPEGEIEARDIPAKAAWSEFGLCAKRREGLWGPTDAARRERMQDEDGVEGGFLGDEGDCYEGEPLS